MDKNRRYRWALPGLIWALFLASCGSDATDPDPDPGDGVFPQLLSDLDINASTNRLYEPRYELWTNGSVKERKVNLTQGGTIDNSNRRRWVFPEGIRFSKTFSYFTQSSPNSLVPVETRIIRMRNGRWEVAVYLWRSDGSDAELQSGESPINVPVTDADGNQFTHVVPSHAQCQECHGANTTFINGFNELQLNSTLAGATRTQLEEMTDFGFFANDATADPEEIDTADPVERAVIGYIEGNCVHCHNAGAGPFDASHEVFLSRTVGQTGPSGNMLIDPGNATGSYLFQRFSGGEMPPLGVDLLDQETIDLMRSWIESLQP